MKNDKNSNKTKEARSNFFKLVNIISESNKEGNNDFFNQNTFKEHCARISISNITALLLYNCYFQILSISCIDFFLKICHFID